jgi:hypothetical protein
MRAFSSPLAATITSVATLTGPAGASTASIWKVERTTNPQATKLTDSSLASVSASGPDEAWSVGTFSDHNALDHPLAEHWNGTTWTRVTVPSRPPIKPCSRQSTT